MIIETKQLNKTFVQGDSQIQAVKDVSMQVKDGETISIIGKSGSGKTTLLSLLTGLEQATTGSITLNGNTITAMSEQELAQYRAKEVGIVFQQFHLIPHLTALENVSLSLEIAGTDDVQEKAKNALKLVGLENRLDHLPSKLSGGENQRVAIARAIVNEPKILFADEPSGNLDLETGKKVMDLIFDICQKQGMTLVLVTHDQQLAQRCQRQVQISNGQMI